MGTIQDKNIKALTSFLSSDNDIAFAQQNLKELKKENLHFIKRKPLYIISSIAASIIIVFSMVNIHTKPKSSSSEAVVVSSAFAYTEISTKAGEIKYITLEDGSSIHLNALSTIRYPKHFSGRIRRVELLQGEAFFSVTKNKQFPFIVSTSDLDIKVLGTSFNVFAYQGYATKATLVEGSIVAYPSNNEDKGIKVSPKESVSIVQGELSINKEVDDTFLWKSGKYSFQNNTLKEIIASLELYYGVSFSIADNALAEHRFSGKFRNESDITTILNTLQKAYPFQYSYHDNKIELY